MRFFLTRLVHADARRGFDIACSQLCGLAHFRMRGIVTVESDEAFRQFLADGAALLR